MRIDILCDECGSDLIGETDGSRIFIVPCKKCLEKSRGAGWDDGYEGGHEDGYEEGYEHGKREKKEENT